MSKTQIITGIERRRKFTDKEKAALVLETMESSLAAVGRKHGIAPSVLYRWREQFPPKSFAMVEVHDNPPKSATPPKPPREIDVPAPPSSMIRVVVQKRIVVEFPLTAEPAAIAMFIKALEN